jgi:dipeptidyl aminopeptidase/acylaminoacyl peptidase
VARVRVPIAFTKIDRWLIGAFVVVAGAAAGVLWLSQAMVAPPRPRVSASDRPTIGLALRADAGVLRVVRAAGPAQEAGLRAGDRIAAIDERKSPTLSDLADRVRAAGNGQMLKIEARRGLEGREETVVLADVKVAVRGVSPADEGLPYEDVAFRNTDGLTLRGWYLPPPPDGVGRAPAIAYGHGNATDRRQWLPVALAVHEAGFAQLLFDFTGRGESDGEVITLGAHEAGDLRSALDSLAARPEVDPLRLAVGGRSMGAVAALFLAADDARVKALVLDSPFADLKALVDRTLASHHVPPVLLRPILLSVAGWRAHYAPGSVRPIEAIRKVKAPILLFHGTKDTLIPFDDALAFKATAAGPFTLVPLVGLDHNAPRPAAYQDRIVTFLTQLLPPSWRTP